MLSFLVTPLDFTIAIWRLGIAKHLGRRLITDCEKRSSGSISHLRANFTTPASEATISASVKTSKDDCCAYKRDSKPCQCKSNSLCLLGCAVIWARTRSYERFLLSPAWDSRRACYPRP